MEPVGGLAGGLVEHGNGPRMSVKFSVGITALVSLIASMLSVGVTIGVMRGDVATAKKAIEENHRFQENIVDRIGRIETAIGRLEVNVETLKVDMQDLRARVR